jgi:hypothetical protein
MYNGMTTVSANNQVGPHFAVAVWSFYTHSCGTLIFKKQIDDLMLHLQSKTWELAGLSREEVQKIPLRHEGDKFAARRQTREIGDRNLVTIENTAYFAQFLVRQLQKFVEQSELIQELKRRRMNGVASEIAVEIGVFFQNNHIHSGTCEEITGHHAGWSAADHEAAGSDVRKHAHE